MSQKQSFCHNLNQASNQETSLTKIVTFGILMDMKNKRTKLYIHLVTKQSFRHNINYTYNQKTSLTKFVIFDILMDDK